MTSLALTDLAGGHVQDTPQQVSQGAVLIQLLLGRKQRQDGAGHGAGMRAHRSSRHPSLLRSARAHLPLWLQAAGTSDFLHVVGGEPQLLLATIISSPPGRERWGSLSTRSRSQSILTGVTGDRQLLHHLLLGFVRLWGCAACQQPPRWSHPVWHQGLSVSRGTREAQDALTSLLPASPRSG